MFDTEGTPSTGVAKRKSQAIKSPDPLDLICGAWAWVSGFLRGLTLITRPADTPTAIKLSSPHDIQPGRKVAFSRPVPLESVQQARKLVANATINDVLVAALTGTVRRFLEKRGGLPEKPGDLQLRGTFPFNTRFGDVDIKANPSQFGNQFVPLVMPLPIHIASPYTRLQKCKERCDELKSGPEAAVVIMANKTAGLSLPTSAALDISLSVFQKVSLLFTNVPGPRDPVTMGGNKVITFGFAVPMPMGINFSILTYAGEVTLGVLSDPKIVEEPQELCECFVEELELLHDASKYHRADKEQSHPVERRAVAKLLLVMALVYLLTPAWLALGGVSLFAGLYVWATISLFAAK
eukprot:NODE_699_length_1971_cov_12.258065_g647_i0.p1 GENE.NODE_699_length_1971_cov_12.258065_g647_i0~~NODE_699_length_1971_cov_12.258065_g647_i0.p1  ORF type:complete len:351 (+),score=51.59 NODE_699_length_1971_cov_12.258065_g647_i0:335-1387(+)